MNIVIRNSAVCELCNLNTALCNIYAQKKYIFGSPYKIVRLSLKIILFPY
jgi:hypothetical protein